jgi:hypothetical protein
MDIIALQPSSPRTEQWFANMRTAGEKLKEATGMTCIVVEAGISIVGIQSGLIDAIEARLQKVEAWIEHEDTLAIEESEW